MIKLVDTNQFALPGTNERFIHIATLVKGVQEFMYFVDLETQHRYLEAITGGHLEFIEDEELVKELEEKLDAAKISYEQFLPRRFLIQQPDVPNKSYFTKR